MTHSAQQQVRSSSLSAVVVRCGCTPRQRFYDNWHGAKNLPCPNPKRTENLGRIAYWNKNPLKLLAWRLGQILRGRRAGVAAPLTE